MKRYKLGLYIFIFCQLLIYAEEISLENSINMAYENNESIKSAVKDNENYAKQKSEAIKTYLPNVNYSMNLGIQEKSIGIELKDTPLTTMAGITKLGIPVYDNVIPKEIELENSETMYMHNITISQPIYNGGLEIAAIKNASIADELGDIQLKKKKKEIKIKVIESYINVLKSKKSIEIMKKSLEELNSSYNRLEEMYNEGMITESKLIEMRYNIINLESTLIGLENGYELAKLSLKNDIGMNQESKIELKEIIYDETELEKIDFDSNLKNGLKNSLDVKMVEISTKMTKASESMSRAGLLPNLNFQFQYSSPQGEDAFKFGDSIKLENWDWQAGLNFNYKLWDWGKSKSELDRAKNDTEKAKLNKQSAIKGIELGIRSAYLEMVRLDKLIEAKQEQLKSAKTNYTTSKEKFNEDLITTDELISAENKIRSSETELENSKLDFYLAKQKYYKMVAKEDF